MNRVFAVVSAAYIAQVDAITLSRLRPSSTDCKAFFEASGAGNPFKTTDPATEAMCQTLVKDKLEEVTVEADTDGKIKVTGVKKCTGGEDTAETTLIDKVAAKCKGMALDAPTTKCKAWIDKEDGGKAFADFGDEAKKKAACQKAKNGGITAPKSAADKAQVNDCNVNSEASLANETHADTKTLLGKVAECTKEMLGDPERDAKCADVIKTQDAMKAKIEDDKVKEVCDKAKDNFAAKEKDADGTFPIQDKFKCEKKDGQHAEDKQVAENLEKCKGEWNKPPAPNASEGSSGSS